MTDNRQTKNAASEGTSASYCSTDWVAALHEANRHVEALAIVRKDNSWDMIAARNSRDEIIEAMSNASVRGGGTPYPEPDGSDHDPHIGHARGRCVKCGLVITNGTQHRKYCHPNVKADPQKRSKV